MNADTNTRKPGKCRIMVQLWGPLFKKLQLEFKALNIKRDRYLNDLFAAEIEKLAKEVTFRNSDAVRARIQEQKLPERVKLTIELDKALAERMEFVLAEKNIPRDSFINRVLYFLVARQATLDHLGVCYDKTAQLPTRPLHGADLCLYDPFFHIREANDNRFYTLPWFATTSFGSKGPNLFSLNTAISADDWEDMNVDPEDYF